MAWRIDRILHQKEKSWRMKILLFPLYLLSIPYGWAVWLRNALYSCNLFKVNRLPCPVISVGNITVGGTGKTPLVMALAKDLQDRGISVAILSRGYKGERTSGPLLSDGKTIYLSSEEAGDEPYLMARRLKDTPILIGKDRFTNGRIAFQQFGVRGILLDDGFQHLQLHRDLNILLVDSTIGFGDHHLLPRGILREPLTHLHRGDLFILTKVERPETCEPLESLIREIHPSARVFHSHYEASALIGLHGELESLDSFNEKKVLALSGIANPSSFLSLLKKCGMKVIKEAIFPDHHRYTKEDLVLIEEKGKEVDGIVTTEKDLVRLPDIGVIHLPIRALRIEMKIWEEAFFQEVRRLF
ncbi:MAG: tetraacyldisaccharide 4'-kinase [Deltaproteobacteria bacterium RBG_16_48_10]|nr:MAG: tetraacyldisaccharide 4'-kinase [Deltaproteobacteria bacterium RBG_16_48_10]